VFLKCASRCRAVQRKERKRKWHILIQSDSGYSTSYFYQPSLEQKKMTILLISPQKQVSYVLPTCALCKTIDMDVPVSCDALVPVIDKQIIKQLLPLISSWKIPWRSSCEDCCQNRFW